MHLPSVECHEKTLINVKARPSIRPVAFLVAVALVACESTPRRGRNIPEAEREITASDVQTCEDMTLRIYATHANGALEANGPRPPHGYNGIKFVGAVRRSPSQIAKQANIDANADTRAWIEEMYGPPLRELYLRGIFGPPGGPGWINYDFVYETQDNIPAENPVVRIEAGEIDSDRGCVIVRGVLHDASGDWNAAGTQLWVFGLVNGKWRVCDFISHGKSFAQTLSGG